MILVNYQRIVKGLNPRSHFKSRLSLIVRVNVVLNRTVVVDSDWLLSTYYNNDKSVVEDHDMLDICFS